MLRSRSRPVDARWLNFPAIVIPPSTLTIIFQTVHMVAEIVFYFYSGEEHVVMIRQTIASCSHHIIPRHSQSVAVRFWSYEEIVVVNPNLNIIPASISLPLYGYLNTANRLLRISTHFLTLYSRSLSLLPLAYL